LQMVFWSQLYVRWILLLAIIVAVVIFRAEFNNLEWGALALPVALVVVSNFVTILVGSLSATHSAARLMIWFSDILMLGVLSYISAGQITFVTATSLALMFIGLLQVNESWTMLHGVSMAVVGIAGLILFGQTTIPTFNSTIVIIAAMGGMASAVAYALNRTVGGLKRSVEQLGRDKDAYLLDVRERANVLSELTFILSSTLNYKTVLDATLEAGRLALRMPSQEASSMVGAIFLYHIEDNLLHVVSARRFTRSDEARTLEGKQGVAGRALREAEPVIGENAHEDAEFQFFVAFQYTKSLLCIPLRAGFDTYGLIVFGSETSNAFSPDQGEMLRAIGLQSTIALQNAVLYSNLLTEKERIIDADEEARKKLARDLHDGPTQGVAGLAMRLAYISKLIEKRPEEVPEELKKAEDLARKTTKEMRHMLFTLRPLVLETQGMSAALNQLSEKMYEMHKQSVAVRVEGDVEDHLDAHQQGVLFYIVEEAVNNARKHAKANLISVTARRQEDVAIIQIVDNGVGFSVEKVQAGYEKRSSLGMVNMRERAEMLDATISIDSVAGKGTVITTIVPLKGADSPQSRKMQQGGTKLERAAISRVERGAASNRTGRVPYD